MRLPSPCKYTIGDYLTPHRPSSEEKADAHTLPHAASSTVSHTPYLNVDALYLSCLHVLFESFAPTSRPSPFAWTLRTADQRRHVA